MGKTVVIILLASVALLVVVLVWWFFVRSRDSREISTSGLATQQSLSGQSDDLAIRCRDYLLKGPPEHMTDYVPESLTEIVIAHAAKKEPLDPELQEIASIILMEGEDLNDIEDQAIREYMIQGAKLVEEVLLANGGQR